MIPVSEYIAFIRDWLKDKAQFESEPILRVNYSMVENRRIEGLTPMSPLRMLGQYALTGSANVLRN